MKNLILYRILSYILLIIAGILSLGVLVAFLSALANPVLLLGVFIMACVIIYSYTSWRFLTRGIDQNLPCKPSLRDLIRVNAFVTIGFSALTLFEAIVILTQPHLITTITEQMAAMQPSAEGAGAITPKSVELLFRFMLTYGVILLIHCFITFRLLKQRRDVFDQDKTRPH
jgi:arginine exporter protein ArgO